MTKLANPRLRNVIGVSAGLGSGLSYGLMSLLIHMRSGSLPAMEINCFRAAFAAVVLLPLVFGDFKKMTARSAIPLWLRSIFGGVSIICFTWNLQHTTIGFANVLFGIAPLIVLIFGWLFGMEQLRPIRIVCLSLVVLGSYIFWKSPHSQISAKVLVVGLVGAIAAALSYVTLKRASHTWNAASLTWAISVVSIGVSLFLKRGPWTALSGNAYLSLIEIGLFGMLGQITVALSYRWADLTTATAIVPSSMLWGVVFGAMMESTTGSRQIIACVIYLAGCIPLTFMTNEKKQAIVIESVDAAVADL